MNGKCDAGVPLLSASMALNMAARPAISSDGMAAAMTYGTDKEAAGMLLSC